MLVLLIIHQFSILLFFQIYLMVNILCKTFDYTFFKGKDEKLDVSCLPRAVSLLPKHRFNLLSIQLSIVFSFYFFSTVFI